MNEVILYDDDNEEDICEGGEDKVDAEGNEEHQEVLVVLVTQTVVQIGTMVVEPLYAILTIQAVEGIIRLYCHIIEAKVFIVNVIFNGNV
eukprot:CAMPEP_0170568044 /NCGR_PEP_ID=MMETSP0211-20121228/80878_1 /TAXON_ID=311385 /ORGANISM="Pseudokeronopsis sp., Strain OXSARD2" /LENGTH=89 /DNA_ID=CAMNT_0010889693 /DNA_START=878 /DNA_END=1147 /DNA_ORIENTATION=+